MAHDAEQHPTRARRAGEFLDHIAEDRDWAATRMGLDLLRDAGIDGLVSDLLVPVQLESGRRWQRGVHTIAREHHVTGLVDELLGAASATLEPPAPDAPRVTLVCAAGEEHATAAHMAVLQVRAGGCDVHFRGGHVTVRDLEGHLRDAPPTALLISCTLAGALVGAADMAEVARRVGVPVVVGGAAIAQSDRVGDVIGSHAGITDPREVPALLRSWQQDGTPRQTTASHPDPSGERALFGPSRRVLLQQLRARMPSTLRPEDESGVELLLATLEAALLLDDAEVVTRHTRWMQERERSGGPLSPPLEQVLETLLFSLPSTLPTSRRFLTAAAEQVRAPVVEA